MIQSCAKKYIKLVCIGPRRSRRVTPMMMARPCPSGSRLLKTFLKSKFFIHNGKMTNFRGILGQS